MNESKHDKLPIACLRPGAFLCFAGWTWVHYYWEGPYGVLVWHDSTFELATRFGVTWEEFVGSGADDGLVQIWIARMWWLYLACTVLTLTVRKKSWIQMSGLVAGSGLLALLSYAEYVAARYQLPMFIEHGGQMLMPILLVMALAIGVRRRLTVITAVLALIMPFAGHGSYAIGLWPTPGGFYAMTSLILGVEYPTAQALLRTAGAVDFLVCIGICIPYTRRASALYATVWGFLTAIARPIAGMSWELNYWGADQYLHQAVLRAPHFLIPLYLFLIWRPASVAEKGRSNRQDLDQPSPKSGDFGYDTNLLAMLATIPSDREANTNDSSKVQTTCSKLLGPATTALCCDSGSGSAGKSESTGPS